MAGTAVVTGANSGIGLATALRLAADGYEVFAGSRRAEGADDIAEAAAASDLRNIRAVTLDVGSDESVAAAFGEILADGPVDVLVNNAGISGGGTVEDTPITTYQSMLDTNVVGVVRCTQQVLPGMREAHTGRIVNVSSAAAIIGPPAMGAYAATKWALEGLSESLQSEVAAFGIRVIVVRPGTIMTPIWGKAGALPSDSPYADTYDFLSQRVMHNLGNTGVAAEVVADVIGDALTDSPPVMRHVVGDADAITRMRERYSDEEICVDLYALDLEARHDNYRRMIATDPPT
jgi:NAD(P)-dependent dehydrogenase (short-subunit alcohol dehydrogenase family)